MGIPARKNQFRMVRIMNRNSFSCLTAISLVLIFSFGMAGIGWSQTGQRSQAHQGHAWWMYFGDHPLNGSWSLHLEGQWRRAAWGARPQQLLLRTGITRALGSSLSMTLGYGFVETYPYGEFPVTAAFPEHRIWQQIQWRHKMERGDWTNRLRLEQRWSNLPQAPPTPAEPVLYSWVSTHRFRVFNRMAWPLRGPEIRDKSVYLATYNELMVNFGRKVAANVFDQNRMYIGLGYQIPRAGRLEWGYMLQTLHRTGGFQVEQNHTLQVGFASRLPVAHPEKTI